MKEAMRFNTAVFYDIENLLKGYSFSAQTLANLSLREILDSASKTGRMSAIAVQRAYANWSDPRLAVLRGEINELGIEPVQVFGFKDPKKNAADIQLAIDAIDLAHVRPSIEVFVIVSGDGGFASLAKKLHEYGRTVIGCAYTSATNRVFQAVCDEFVPIPDPDDGTDWGTNYTPRVSTEGPQLTTPLLRQMARAVKRSQSFERQAAIQKAKEVLDWIRDNAESRRELGSQGLYLSVVAEAIRYAVPDFEPIRAGFGKFVEYLQYLCSGSELCVFRSLDGTVVLTTRSNTRLKGAVLPDLDDAFVHSAENYRTVLAIGPPGLKLPEPGDLNGVAAWIAATLPRQIELGAAIEAATSALDGTVSSEGAKRALLCFISIGIFERQSEGTSLFEHKLTLKDLSATREQILGMLRIEVTKKLHAYLGQVNDELLEELLPTLA